MNFFVYLSVKFSKPVRKGTVHFLLALSMLYIPSNLCGQTRKYSNEFLSVGIGARALGMSNSTVASVQDVTAGYWNPAGLAGQTGDMQAALMHSEYFAGIAKFDYAGFSSKVDSSSFIGFSAIRFGVDDIPNTLELIDANGNVRYDLIRSFSAADYAFMFSYARKNQIPGFNYGATVKVIRRKTGNFASAWGFGIDLGARFDKKHWHFGLSGRDITSTFNAWKFDNKDLKEVYETTGNELPENSVEITLPKLILGISRDFNINKKIEALTELDAEITFDGKRPVLIQSNPVCVDPHLGVEFSYNHLVFIRAGVGNIQHVPGFGGKNQLTFQPNLGLGLCIKRLCIDYALTDIGDQSIALYSNVFSLRYTFDHH